MKQPVKYCLGFMFDESRQNVALIRKLKPEWQKGKLNGIGGKMEVDDQFSHYAMAREFKEETGYKTTRAQWFHFCEISGLDFSVHCFAAHGDISKLESAEAETVEIWPVAGFNPLRKDCIESLPWLIAMAIDYLSDFRPMVAFVKYP